MQLLNKIWFAALIIFVFGMVSILIIQWWKYGDDDRCFSVSCRSY